MPSDEELMLAAGRGDLAAFEQLVLRYQGVAWGVAYRFSGNRSEAEDIAQESFLRLLNAAERYRPTGSFRTFFHRIVTRLALDFTEKKRPSAADLAEFPSAQASDADPLTAGERVAAVDRALAALPPKQRAAVVLRYYENLGHREIAESLGTSAKAIERLLARARATLEPLLEGLQEE